MKFIQEKYSKDGRYIEKGVSYNGLKEFDVSNIKPNKKLEFKSIRTIRASSPIQHVGYAWSTENTIFYRPLKYPGSPLVEYNPDLDIFIDLDSKNLSPRNFLEDQSSISSPVFNASHLAGKNYYLRANVYGENPFRVFYSTSGKVKLFQVGEFGFVKSKPRNPPLVVQTTQGKKEISTFVQVPGKRYEQGAHTIAEMSRGGFDRNTFKTLTANQFRTAENRMNHPVDGDIGVQHFYYLSNINRNHVALLRYDDKIGEGVTSEAFAPVGESVTHVSTNRDGSELYWAITEEGMPKYHFFSDKAQALFKLIDLKTPHRSEILSIDSAGRMAIIKRQSMAKGLEYLLVDTQEKAGRVLSSCPKGNGGNVDGMPWADVTAMDFTASDGKQVWNFLYRPPQTLKNEPRPTIIYVHGGPSDHYIMDWSDVILKGMVDRGYNVLVVNYRGSTGYGRKFREDGWQNFERARLDVVEAAEFAAKTGIADPDKIAVMGNSYGGYLSMAIAALDNHPFKAAVSRNGIPDLVKFLEQSFVRSDGKRFTYDAVSDVFGNVNDASNRTYLTKNSPTTGAATMTTPLLIAHAKSDDKVPFNQGHEFFNTLANANPYVVVNFLPLKGGHNFSDLDEMNKYLDQADWFIKQAFKIKN
ncbi:MAG: alpha/beta fold hydrolase [Robiginitomaculum sp.]|nr:alpha/beta fold hydrolase [Robiginitomaculum sp.]